MLTPTPPEVLEDAARRESINKIAQLDIDAYGKAELVLILLGLKPATTVRFRVTPGRAETFESTLRGAGLAFVKMEVNTSSLQKYAIALTQATIEQLLALDPSKDHEAYGKMMGFPQTAIDAFVGPEKKVISPDDLHLDDDVVMRQHKLSIDHWREEQEVFRRWSDAIKQYAPELHEELKNKQKKGRERRQTRRDTRITRT